MDVDLSILGQPERRFWQYETAIRQEYDWVKDFIFRQKRAKILETVLGRERIYSTEWLHERYEQRARNNLTAALKRLKTYRVRTDRS